MALDTRRGGQGGVGGDVCADGAGGVGVRINGGGVVLAFVVVYLWWCWC